MDPSEAGELQRLTLAELRERAEALDARIREHLKREARPRATTVMQCAVCERRGPVTDTRHDAVAWAFGHREENAGHAAFREITTRPYRW
jgi:hypothetical protein